MIKDCLIIPYEYVEFQVLCLQLGVLIRISSSCGVVFFYHQLLVSYANDHERYLQYQINICMYSKIHKEHFIYVEILLITQHNTLPT